MDEPTKSEYEFINGSLDGHVIVVTGNILNLQEWSSPADQNGRREIYKLNSEGKFQFDRYSLTITRPFTAAMVKDWSEIAMKLLPIFKELDEIVEKHGGPDARPLTIGNWTIQHKDA